jgi:allantoinase
VSFDLVVRGGASDVAVVDGVVAAVGPELAGGAREEIDARELLVLPGAVDAHVHFNEPGRAEWEGWASGTRAAAAGGTTTCVEMPLNAHPPTVDGAAFDAKVAAARASAVVDFALWGGLVGGDLDRMNELADRGVVGFKAFMSDSGIEDFPAVDDDALGAGMARAAALGLPVAVHAERPAELLPLRGGGWRDWVASRPVAAEVAAIERALELAEETGCALHVVHVSSAAGVAAVAAARERGVDVSCETCPHYLLLTADDLERLGTLAKCAPPLRDAAERDALWRELRAGRIDFVASDHSPCPPELKAGGFDTAWGGIAGCQTLLAALLGSDPADLAAGATALGEPAAAAPALAEPALAELVAAAPARRLALAGKGRLEPGADADLVLVDPAARGPLHRADLHDRHRANPFAGRTFAGRVVRTLVRGRTVFHAGRIVATGGGRLLTPDPGAR